MRAAPVLVALALLASACSASTPVGQVGATLSAMDGTVTLDKVLSPAPVAIGSVGAALGHKLVAVVLTVHSPTASPGKFAAIYTNSKLVDSSKLAHIGKSTAKYKVFACVAYPPFSSLGAGQTATGCVVFNVPTAATPVELKITGKANADWKIAASAVQPGTAPSPIAKAPSSKVPLTEGGGTTTTIVGGLPTTTAAPGTKPAGETTTTRSATRGTTSTTTAKTSGSPPAHSHRHGVTKVSRIVTVTPRGASVGSRVQILGRRLTGATEVTFNGVAARIKKDMPGRIVVVVPEGATNGPVTVTTPSGTITSPRSFVVF
ncbi:MAG TPA: hypothetical protein VMU64_08010 [Acidimicrobiales bacterium]|nr:hypothetical protein [Acidimicrobiales bacterium]